MTQASIVPVLCALLLTACSEPESFSPKGRAIADLFMKLKEDGLFNGTVLAAVNGNVVYKGTHGNRSFNPDVPINPDDAFRIGSISKPFTAVAIHMLAERGQLGYDDALSKFFPDLPYDNVAIGNLLSHTSGLYDVYEEIEMREAFYAFYDRLDPPYTNKDYLEYMIAYRPELIGEPLERDGYSNTAYVLLALIVEQVSGQRFDVFLKQNIFDPIGMGRTGIISFLKEEKVPYIVSSYRDDPVNGIQPTPDPKIPRSMYGLTYGDDEMYTTVDDLLMFDTALREGKLLNPESLERMMQSPTLTDGRPAGYGQGLSVRNISGERYVTHTGSSYGFLSYWKHGTPDNENTIIVFSNVRSQRNTFQGVHTAINRIMRDEPYDQPRLSITYPLAEAIEREGPGMASEVFDRLSATGNYFTRISQLNALGRLYSRSEKNAEARVVYELVLRLNPENTIAHAALAEIGE